MRSYVTPSIAEDPVSLEEARPGGLCEQAQDLQAVETTRGISRRVEKRAFGVVGGKCAPAREVHTVLEICRTAYRGVPRDQGVVAVEQNSEALIGLGGGECKVGKQNCREEAESRASGEKFFSSSGSGRGFWVIIFHSVMHFFFCAR